MSKAPKSIPESIPAGPSAESRATDTPILSASNLTKSFGQTRALRGASIDIDAGEIVAIMGSSGSGKSTFLHCLAGILVPDFGIVTFDGQDVGAMADGPRSALRRKDFGFVFQFGQLVPELSCLENVTLPLQLSGMKKAEARAEGMRWLETLDVVEQAGKRPGEVSGGQGQRIAVARALAPSPRVIFADEPTGALDSLSGEHVMELLTNAARETDCAVVLVTHEARVAAWADREVIIRDGRCVDPFGTSIRPDLAPAGTAP